MANLVDVKMQMITENPIFGVGYSPGGQKFQFQMYFLLPFRTGYKNKNVRSLILWGGGVHNYVIA